MKLRPSFVVVCLVVACVAQVMFAGRSQAQVAGSITGTVIDQTGTPLSGVKITARSPTQIGGAKTVYTDADGGFRLPSLQPGTFEVRASAPRMQDVVQRGVQVGITSATDVTLMMEVKGKTETVQVIEKAPTVSTTAANVRAVYDLEYVESLPIDGLATKVEPFVNANTPGAGAGGDRFRGGTNRQNQFMVEGFSMGNQRYTMKSLATIEAQTAAYGAENASAQGAVVNMVTKSGGNRHELDVSTFYEDSRLSPFRAPGDRVAPVTRFNVNPGLSGPVIKDKLWYYANVELRHEFRGYDPDPAGLMPTLPSEQTFIGRGSFKLTWQISPRHKLSSFSLYNREGWSNMSDGNYTRETLSTYNSPRLSAFSGLTWEALLADSLFYRAQVGVQETQSQYFPQNCETDDDCLEVPPIEQMTPYRALLGNYEQSSYDRFKSFETIHTVEWFPAWKDFGSHDVKLSSRYFLKNDTNYLAVPGDRKMILNNGAFDRQIDYFSNDPRLDGTERRGYYIRGATGSLLLNSLSDSVRFGRFVTVNAGVALTTTISETQSGQGSLTFNAFTPHVSAIWDVAQDGRTVVRGSFANYVDADAVRISRYALGEQVSRECKVDDPAATRLTYNRECEFRGGASKATFGLPCGPTGLNPDGTSCRQELRLPRMWEYTMGVEREVVPGFSLGADAIYRVFTHPYELYETNRIWNQSGSALLGVGGYRNGRPETIQDVETPDAAQRRYRGVTVVARKREGRLRVMMGYTWSKLEGNVDNGGDSNLLGDIAPRDVYLWGYLQDDHRHDIRGSLVYAATSWLSFGSTASFASGAPYSRFYRNTVTGTVQDLRARVGCEPGSNLNSPDDDRCPRLPDIMRVNLRVSSNLKPLTGHNIDLSLDALNVLNMRTATAVITESGPTFGAPRTTMNPTLLRLGARYRY
jgi:hypothetical protein